MKSAEKAENSQRLTGKSGRPKPRRPSIEVKDTSTRRRRRRKKGGWKSTKGLRWEQVQQVYELQKLAAEAGTPLNWRVDIHTEDETLRADDAECKRWLSNKTKDIQQAVHGRGKTPRQASVPCVTVYEKRVGGDLHAHMWMHVAKGNDALERFHDGAEFYVHRAHSKTADYLTKSRLPVGDAETEATFPHKRQGGQAAIKGSRITFNADAKGLLAANRKPAPAPAAAAPIVIPEPVVTTPTQLAFTFDAPVIDIRSQIEAARIERGLSQRQLAAVLGMKQPHYSNAVIRRHDPLGAFARRRALEWLNAA